MGSNGFKIIYVEYYNNISNILFACRVVFIALLADPLLRVVYKEKAVITIHERSGQSKKLYTFYIGI